MPHLPAYTDARPASAILLLILALFPLTALAHSIAGNNASFVQAVDGPAVTAFMYLGAKHMVTGYDHLLYLIGVIFFLYRPADVVKYVTLFAVGHSLTLVVGVLGNIRADAFLIDAVIGLSIVYKALENIGGLGRFRPDPRIAVFVFGLIHGFGLATRLQEFALSENGLLVNLISFNIGVELGQILALSLIFLALTYWRASDSYNRLAFISNGFLMLGGFLLAGYHICGWWINAV